MDSKSANPSQAADEEPAAPTKPDFELLVRNYIKASPYITIPYAQHLVSVAKKPPINSSSVVLDIGCGPGIIAGTIDNRNSTIHAIDIAQAMIATLNSYQWDNVIGTVMDGQNLTYADEIFTHVFSNFSIFTFADSKAGMREAVRVLRDGGWFGGTSWNHLAWCKPAERAWRRLRPVDDTEEEIEWPMPEEWRTVKDVKMRMKEAGLKDIKVYYEEKWTKIPSSDYIIDCLAPYMKMVMKQLGRLCDEEWGMFAGYMAEELDKDLRRTKEGVEAKLIAVVATGRKRIESSSSVSCFGTLKSTFSGSSLRRRLGSQRGPQNP